MWKVVDSPDKFESSWRILKELHRKRWHAKGKEGAFESCQFFNFHHWVFEQLCARGQAKFLLIGDRNPIAAIYCFYLYDRVYYYQSGIDVGCSGSPGILAHLAVLNEIEDSFKHYDFMLGGRQSYKASWASELAVVKDISCYTRSVQGSWQRINDEIKERIRTNRFVKVVRQR